VCCSLENKVTWVVVEQLYGQCCFGHETVDVHKHVKWAVRACVLEKMWFLPDWACEKEVQAHSIYTFISGNIAGSTAFLPAVMHEQEARLPPWMATSFVWKTAKVLWAVMSMNYACLAFYVRSLYSHNYPSPVVALKVDACHNTSPYMSPA
jgi:hypothetical protein